MTQTGDHIPVLETERLRLRAPAMQDLPAYATFAASERSQFVGGPFTADEAQSKLRAMIDQWSTNGYGRFVLEHDGQPIGHAGLLAAADQPGPELTWTIWNKAFTAQGLMTEALIQVIRHAVTLGFAEVISRVAPENLASRKMAERIGGTLLAHGQFADGTACVIYRHDLSATPAPVRSSQRPAPTAPIIPERIETERLILRRPVEADRTAYVHFYTTERSALAMGPFDEAGANAFFDKEMALWEQKGFGMHSLFAKDAPNIPIGLAGVWQPEGWPAPELGWLLWEGAEGKGYAQEAASAVRNTVFAKGWSTLISYINVENTASARTATRLGARLTDASGEPQVWQHRPEWAQ